MILNFIYGGGSVILLLILFFAGRYYLYLRPQIILLKKVYTKLFNNVMEHYRENGSCYELEGDTDSLQRLHAYKCYARLVNEERALVGIYKLPSEISFSISCFLIEVERLTAIHNGIFMPEKESV